MVLWLNFDSLSEFLTRLCQKGAVGKEQNKHDKFGYIHCFVKPLLSKRLVAFSFKRVRHYNRSIYMFPVKTKAERT